MKSDLSNVRVGDKIWTIQEGWTVVKEIRADCNYPIVPLEGSFTLKGNRLSEDKHPSAFLENPFEKEITREVEEEIIEGFLNSKQMAQGSAFNLRRMDDYLDQKYKPLPTAEEAAEKLGITVEQLKEIVK